MGGPFAFFGGLISLATSAGIGAYQNRHNRADNREYIAGNYNMSVQISQYDSRGELSDAYSYQRVQDNILKEYPNMPPLDLDNVTWMAMAKVKMESETPYNYYVNKPYRVLGDISRFVTEDCKI